MLILKTRDLSTDVAACWVVKDEIVAVEFAAVAGTLDSAVGLNSFVAADALVTESTGDRWSVSRARFDANAGDWLMQYAPADHGIVAAARFNSVYRMVDDVRQSPTGSNSRS